MMGYGVMVAPILQEGQRSRNIYLPQGSWIDANTLAHLVGGRWLTDYSAPLDVLPYFIRINSSQTINDGLNSIDMNK